MNALLHASSANHHRRWSSSSAKILVVAQVGGSLMLLIVAGLFVRSLLNVQRSDLGFDPQHVLNITLNPRSRGLQRDAVV